MTKRSVFTFNILGLSMIMNPVILYIAVHFFKIGTIREIQNGALKFNFDKIYILLFLSLILLIILERVVFSDKALVRHIEKVFLKNKIKKIQDIAFSYVIDKFVISSSLSSFYIVIGIIIAVTKGAPFYAQPYFVTSLIFTIESFIYFKKKIKNIENNEYFSE